MPPIHQHTQNRFGIRSLLACLVFGVGTYVFVVIAAYYTQAAIIFRPGGLAVKPPPEFPIETVSIPTSDGLFLNGWWLSTPGARHTVLYFQGNRRQASAHTLRLKTLAGLGVNALLFDYRGFGQSAGRIGREEDIYRDGRAAWQYLRHDRRIPAREIILWGRSLGGAVAVEVARHQTAGALVLESTFYALEDMARIQYRWLPTRYLLKFHFRSGAKLRDIRAPIMIVHSPVDGYVPFTQGRQLFDEALEPKVLLTTTGHHLELFDRHPDFRQQFTRHLVQLTHTKPSTTRLP